MVSRAVRPRVQKRAETKSRVRSGMESLKGLYSRPLLEEDVSPPSVGRRAAVVSIRAAYEQVGPPPCTNAAAAFDASCGWRPGYGPETTKAANLLAGSVVSLPVLGSEFVDARELLDGEDLEAWGCIGGAFSSALQPNFRRSMMSPALVPAMWTRGYGKGIGLREIIEGVGGWPPGEARLAPQSYNWSLFRAAEIKKATTARVRHARCEPQYLRPAARGAP